MSPSNKGYEAADFTYKDKDDSNDESGILGLTSALRMFWTFRVARTDANDSRITISRSAALIAS